VKRTPRAERARRVGEVLEMVRLQGYAGRKPAQLSGGQRQRVALARAIVNRPQVLLLDEPLGALDLKLRQEMQVFLKQLQTELGITFVYVTHDQEEALTMSDRLAVFNDGRIEQVGAPAEVYERPLTEFVAGFVGTSNVLERGGRRISVRPERVRIGDEGEPGQIADVVFVGSFIRVLVDLASGERVTAVRPNDGDPPRAGAPVRLSWRDADAFPIQPPIEQQEER
jgi:putative spermidine/putrescine transport system ATP-binding protein